MDVNKVSCQCNTIIKRLKGEERHSHFLFFENWIQNLKSLLGEDISMKVMKSHLSIFVDTSELSNR